MSHGSETVEVVEPWLWSTLSGDAELMDMIGGQDSLIGTLAYAGVTAPYVVFFLSSSRDVVTVPMIRSQIDAIYTVKAVSESATWEQVKPIAARINVLLDQKNVTTVNGSVACYRESIVQYAEVEQAVQFRHLGGLFRVRANTL